MVAKIAVPGAAEATFELQSTSRDGLVENPAPGDPAWAPYAVTLRSAFLDFVTRFVDACGMLPVQPGLRFTFEDAAADSGWV